MITNVKGQSNRPIKQTDNNLNRHPLSPSFHLLPVFKWLINPHPSFHSHSHSPPPSVQAQGIPVLSKIMKIRSWSIKQSFRTFESHQRIAIIFFSPYKYQRGDSEKPSSPIATSFFSLYFSHSLSPWTSKQSFSNTKTK